MKKNGKLANTFVWIALVEVALIILYAGYLVFNLGYKSRELSVKTAELQQLVETSKTIETLKSQIEKEKANLLDAYSSFFNDDTLLLFFKNFQDVCGNNGVNLTRISFGTLSVALDGSPPIKTLPVQINFSSNYNSVIRLLEYLEQYKMHIKEVNLTFNGSDGSLDLTFYLLTNSADRWVYEGKVHP